MLIFALYKELQKADRRHEAALGIPQTPKALYAIEIQEDRQSRWLRHTNNISNIFQ